MIKTVFDTEGLLAQTDQFLHYCESIVNFAIADKFYIFTCVNLIQSANPKMFFRERVFKSLLRFFYFLANLKEQIEQKTYIKEVT